MKVYIICFYAIRPNTFPAQKHIVYTIKPTQTIRLLQYFILKIRECGFTVTGNKYSWQQTEKIPQSVMTVSGDLTGATVEHPILTIRTSIGRNRLMIVAQL